MANGENRAVDAEMGEMEPKSSRLICCCCGRGNMLLSSLHDTSIICSHSSNVSASRFWIYWTYIFLFQPIFKQGFEEWNLGRLDVFGKFISTSCRSSILNYQCIDVYIKSTLVLYIINLVYFVIIK
ncbi:hypothetical protein Dimus_016039 [Dionaea muscipula]